jgi:hypothetical protein
MEKNITRGIRNNNPGNIRKSNDPWQGLSEVQDDKEFFKFKSMAFGIRAVARTLITYQDKYGIRTIRDFVARYAPEKENNTANYMACVCGISGFSEDQVLDFHKYEEIEPVIRGILFIENGSDNYKTFKKDDIDAGLTLAGVTPNKSIFNSRHIRATAVAAGAGVSIAYQAFNDSVQQISPVLPLIQRVEQYWPLLASCVLFGALGYIVYSRIRDRKRGL